MPGATQYSIYRGTAPGAESATAIGTSGGTTYSDGSAANATTYYYYVKAQYGTSFSGPSPEASVTPGTPTLTAPMVVAQPAAGAVKVYWTKNLNATFYLMQRWDPVVGWRVIFIAPNVNTISRVDTSVVNGQEYSYRVLAGNVDGVGDVSDSFTAAAGDTPVSAPGGAWATPYNGYIHLSWNAVPAATGYVIYRGNTAGSETLSPYKVVGTNNSWDDTVPNGNTRFYKVAAIDPSGVGFQSPEASAQAGATKLAAPLVVSTTAGGYVRVDWSAVASATGYTVFRSVGNQNSYGVYTKTAGTTFSYTDTAVVPGTRYYYMICGTNASGTGNGGTTMAKAGSQLPAAPSGLSAQPSSTYITLYWNTVPSIYYYNIYRGTAPGKETLYDTMRTGSSYTDSNVDTTTTYYYKVKAFATATEGYYSPEASAQAGSTKLAAPLIAGGVSSGKVYLAIGLVPGATSYNVYRTLDPNGNGPYTLIRYGLVPVSGDTYVGYTDPTGIANVTYTYLATAVASTGEGSASNKVTATPGNLPLAAPSGTIAFAANDHVYIQCDPQTSASNFNIYRSLTPTMPNEPYAVNQSNTFNDYGVTPGTLYYYAFTAVDPDGQSLKSPSCSAKPGIAAVPAPILTLDQGATSCVLNWSAIGGVIGYDVYRADSSATGIYKMIAQNVPGTTYTDTDVTVGLQYTYKIYPVSVNGAGSVSNRVVGIPGSSRLAAPTGLAAYAGGTYVTVKFNSVLGAANYNLYRSTIAGGEGSVPIMVGNGAGTIQDSGLVAGTRYYYKVTAVDDHGQSIKSEEVSAKVGSSQLSAPSISAIAVTTTLKTTWTSVAGATSYNLYRAIAGGNWVLYRHVTGNSYIDTSVIQGATYYYLVRAVNADGEGNSSNTVNLHT